jgi:hypothetical protein
VVFPPPGSVPAGSLDNRELDKLVGTLGRNKATWRRALVLSQWLQDSGHVLDDRLCTTVRQQRGVGCAVLWLGGSDHAICRLQCSWAVVAQRVCLLSPSAVHVVTPGHAL